MPKRAAPGGNTGNNRDKKRKRPPVPSASKSKREIVFDPEARKEYLRGFSDRKKQRRAYGLAMQKVKDRKEKLEQRKQNKKDELQRVEEAEQQKAAYFEEMVQQQKKDDDPKEREDEDDKKEGEGSGHQSEGDESKAKAVLDTKTYDDRDTETHWGGRVTVTTSVVDLGDDDSSDDDEDSNNRASADPKKYKSVDKRQQYAGNVDKYMAKLKGNMPGRKKAKDAATRNTKRKGKNGAAEMKGVGGAANLNLAQKFLSKANAKQGPASSQGKRKNGKNKSRR
jgi:ribosomal RNA-processing protein 17